MSGITPSPDPIDVTEFSFSQMRPIRLSNQGPIEDPILNKTTQLLAVGNNTGVIFAGVKNGLAYLDVLQAESVDMAVEKKEDRKHPMMLGKGVLTIDLPTTPTHLSLSNDDLLVSVSLILNGLPYIYIFDARAFVQFKNNPENIKPFLQIDPTTPPGTSVKDLQWNPVTTNLLAVTYSNGSLALFSIDGGKPPECWTLPPAEGIACINWSPKGKQLVAGRSNGSLTQYKPDLKEARTIPGPVGKNFSTISILWVSTYQFIVCYKDNSDQNSLPGIYLVQAGKTGPATFTFYDDICYSSGTDRQVNFSSIPVNEWGVILVSSANAIEVGVLGSVDKEQTSWVQWMPPDHGRAEIPLGDDQKELFPVGIALSMTTQQRLQFGESFLPTSMPALFILAPDGLLCGFYVVNRANGVLQVTKSPKPITSTAGMFPGTINLPRKAPQAAKQPEPRPPIPSQQQQPPLAFGSSLGSLPGSFMSSTPAKPPPQSKAVVAPIRAVVTEQVSKQASQPPQQIKDSKPPKPASPVENIHELAYGKAIGEEIKAFSSELLQFKQKASQIRINVGSNEDKDGLKLGVDKLERFSKDLFEITQSQSKEIQNLQKTTIELFALVEEAKSRDVLSKNSRYRQVLKNRPLDSSSKKRLAELDSKFLGLERQLQQVNQMLDLEWEDHIKKTKARRMGDVSMGASHDMIYKSILNNRNILEIEKNNLERIKKEMKNLRIKPGLFPSFRSADGSENVAEITQMFQEKTSISETNQTGIFSSPTANASSRLATTPHRSPQVTNFSPEKQTALRNFLMSKGTTKVRPIDSALLNEAAFQKMKTSVKVEPQSTTTSHLLLSLLNEREKKEGNSPIPFSTNASGMNRHGQGENQNQTQTAQPAFGRAQPKQTIPVPFASTPPFAPSTNSAATKSSTLPKPSIGFGTPVSETVKPVATKSDSTKPKGLEAGSSFFSTPSGTGTGSHFGTPNAPVPFGSGAKTEPKPTSTTRSSTPMFGADPSKSTSSFTGFGGGSVVTPVATTTQATSATKPVAISSGFSFDIPTTTTTATTKASITSPATTSASKAVISTPVATTAKPFSTFGSATTTPVSKPAPIQQQESAKAEPLAKPIVTTSSSLFGGSATTSGVSGGSIFGGVATSGGSIFGGPSTPSKSLFGSEATTTSQPAFGSIATTTSQSLFGGSTSTVVSSTAAAPTTTASGSVFGGSVAATTSSNTPSSGGSVFGGSTATSGGPTLFGGASTPATSAPIFGKSGGSVFGGTATSPGGSIFGAPATTSTAFGGTQPSGGGSIFGGASSTAPSEPSGTQGASIFGGSTSGAGLFGKSSGTGSIFGSAATTPSTTSSPFSGAPLFGGASTTPKPAFGQTGSIFGTPTTSATSGSIFGTPSTSAPTGSVFGTASTSAPTGSVFGTPSTSAPTGSVFGGATTSSSGFGSADPVGGLFGSGGGFFSGLGSTPTQDNSNKNVFGTASSTFGSPNPANTSLFGGGQTSQSGFGTKLSIFGGSTGGSAFGGSGTSQGFGQSTSPSKPSGFGSPSVFGAAPAFGSAPVFGAPAFGSAPTLGSGAVPTAFGSSVANNAPVFGSALASDVPTFGSVGGSSTFGSISQQAPSSFGGFGQQSSSSGFGSGQASASPPAFSGSPSFSSWR